MQKAKGQFKIKNLALLAGLSLVLVGCKHVSVKTQENNQQQESRVVLGGSFVKGQRAPAIVVESFEGKEVDLSQHYGKRAVVLDFWAGWCPYCVEEMPELQKAAEKYKDRLVVIGVHRTETESVKLGEKFAQDKGVTYMLVKDDGSLYKATGGVGMPVAVFIDKTGRVVEIKTGPKTAEEIGEKIESLL